MITLELTAEEAKVIRDMILAGEHYYLDQYEFRNETVNEWYNIADNVRWEIMERVKGAK